MSPGVHLHSRLRGGIISAHRPEYDDESVKDVETVANVSEQSVGDDLQQHLHSEQETEEEVAVLEHLSQSVRLYTPLSQLMSSFSHFAL